MMTDESHIATAGELNAKLKTLLRRPTTMGSTLRRVGLPER